MMKNNHNIFYIGLFAILIISAVLFFMGTDTGNDPITISIDEANVPYTIVPLQSGPLEIFNSPVASGEVVYSGLGGTMDASNTTEGYIMCKFDGATTTKLKVMITGPSGVPYYYDLNAEGTYETFPFTDGNGSYKVAILKNTAGTKYSYVLLKTIEVTMENEFAPFLVSNQYVNYDAETLVVQEANKLLENVVNEIAKIETIFGYVVNNYSYDTQLAANVQSGYLPNLDSIYEAKEGICFDYAAITVAMLRSQGIPAKLEIGYVSGNLYHAWVSAYTENSGWQVGLYFDGEAWNRLDPTFMSSSDSEAIREYVGNGENYNVKYSY